MDGFELADLARRVRNMVRKGVVHSVQMSPPRCRVSLGVDPVTQREHVTGWLVWGAQADASRQEWNVPAVGSPVTILSESGDLRQGTVYPGGITDDQTPASDSPTQHITRFSNGAYFMYDSAANHYEISLPAGGTVKIIGPGGIELDADVVITKTLTVNQNASVGGDLAAKGDITDKDGESGSIQDLRDMYNIHDHEYNDGTTSPPNQKVTQVKNEGNASQHRRAPFRYRPRPPVSN